MAGQTRLARAKIRRLFRPGPPLPGTNARERRPHYRFDAFLSGARWSPIRDPNAETPSPRPSRHPPSPEGGLRRDKREGGSAPPAGAGTEIHRMFEKGVGPPDAVNTGGPVPLLEILAGKGGFAGQVRRRFRP